jgi:hypothetical protein
MGGSELRNVSSSTPRSSGRPLVTSSAKRGELSGGHYASFEHAPSRTESRKNRDCLGPSRLQDPTGPNPIRPIARNYSLRGNVLRRSRTQRRL